ncbi:uncharacterized protein LOC111126814 [Crassostrea virginica]
MADSKKRDLLSDAKNFCDGLSNVFMLKKRDPQTRHLLEKAKLLIENLISENQRGTSNVTSTPRGSRTAGGMGQLWVKLDELKRENEELRKQAGKPADDRPSLPPKPSQGPGDVIIGDLHKTKRENEALKAKVERLETRIREMEGVALSVQDEYKRAKVALETTQKSMETVLKDYRQMEDELKLTKKENESLKQKLARSILPIGRTDNRLVETISEKCRPSNIAQLYNTLESQEWVDAKETLEDITDFREEDIVQFLCACVMASFQSCKEVYNALKATIAELLRKPTLVVNDTLVGDRNGKSKLPDDMTDSIGHQLRQHFDDIDSDVIVGMMCEKLTLEFTEFVQRHPHENKVVQKFMNQCAKVTWQMVIQHPPMWLSVDDQEFDDEKHKLWWSCDHAAANCIDFFVWPALYDYKRGNLLIKGCVYAS